MTESRDRAVLDAAEWVRYFGILCRDDGLDDIYNAEEKLQAHDEAMRRQIADLEDERDAAVGVARAHRIRTEAAEAALAEMTGERDTALNLMRAKADNNVALRERVVERDRTIRELREFVQHNRDRTIEEVRVLAERFADGVSPECSGFADSIFRVLASAEADIAASTPTPTEELP